MKKKIRNKSVQKTTLTDKNLYSWGGDSWNQFKDFWKNSFNGDSATGIDNNTANAGNGNSVDNSAQNTALGVANKAASAMGAATGNFANKFTGRNNALAASAGVQGSGWFGLAGQSAAQTGYIIDTASKIWEDNHARKQPEKYGPVRDRIGLNDQIQKQYHGYDFGGMTDIANNTVAQIGNAIEQSQLKDDPEELKRQTALSRVNDFNQNTSWDTISDVMTRYSDLRHTKKRDFFGSVGAAVANPFIASGTGMAAGSSAGPIGSIIGAGIGTVTSIAGILTRNRKAKKARDAVNAAIDARNRISRNAIQNQIGELRRQSEMNAIENAYNEIAKGGPLFTNGSEFSNGVDIINNGGTHEENPYEGVMVSVDKQGVPNLVEEGETIWNDYVFSNRLKVPEDLRKQFKLRKNATFADASKKIQKESSETPNDPINIRGLNNSMIKLMNAQEDLREAQKIKESDQEIMQYLNDAENAEQALFDLGGSLTARKTKLANLHKKDGVLNTEGKGDRDPNLSLLRFAPAVASGMDYLADVIGKANKPDYTWEDELIASAKNIRNVTPERINQELPYKPVDPTYQLNQLENRNAAQTNAIINNAGLNRNVAIAGIAANNLGDLAARGEAYRNAEALNADRLKASKLFGMQRDTQNATMDLQAQEQNADIAKVRSMFLAEANKRKQDNLNLITAAKAANKKAFYENLSEIGKEEYVRQSNNSINPFYKMGVDGKVRFKKAGQDALQSILNNPELSDTERISQINDLMTAFKLQQEINNEKYRKPNNDN